MQRWWREGDQVICSVLSGAEGVEGAGKHGAEENEQAESMSL